MILVRTYDINYPVKVDGTKFYIQDSMLYVTDAEGKIVAIFKDWSHAIEERAVSNTDTAVLPVTR